MSDAAPRRRFPPPWTPHEIPGGYLVKDARGITVAWVYARDDLHARSNGQAWLTTDEARRIAKAISRLPELLAPASPAADPDSEGTAA